MADSWVLVQIKKIYRPARMWDNLISDSLDVDFTHPIFWKFKIFGQVGWRACDMGPYNWLYRRL